MNKLLFILLIPFLYADFKPVNKEFFKKNTNKPGYFDLKLKDGTTFYRVYLNIQRTQKPIRYRQNTYVENLDISIISPDDTVAIKVDQHHITHYSKIYTNTIGLIQGDIITGKVIKEDRNTQKIDSIFGKINIKKRNISCFSLKRFPDIHKNVFKKYPMYNYINKTLSTTNIKAIHTLNNLEFKINKLVLRPYSNLANINNMSTNYATTNLECTHNNLTNINFLKLFPNLKKIDLQHNNISDISTLEEMEKLSDIKLNNNNISDITPLKNAKKLLYLNLSDNKISNLKPLENLSNLNKLYLSNNNIDNIDALKSLSKLEAISLNYNKVSDINPLQGIVNLSDLKLNSNKITNFNVLEKLNNLKHLYLDNNNIKAVTNFPKIQHLQTLSLNNNNISDITNFPKMQHLNTLLLNHNNIKDINSFKWLTSLKNFEVSHNQLTEIKLKKTKILEKLNLSHNKITKIDSIENNKIIKLLDLSYNNISYIAPLKSNTKIGTLLLNNNKLTDISFLKSAFFIWTLNLQNNQIKNIEPLKKSTIIDINLSNNKVENISPLNNLRYLKKLNLLNNKNIKNAVLPKNLEHLIANYPNISFKNEPLYLIHFDFNDKASLNNVLKKKIKRISFASFNGSFEFLKDIHACYYLNFSNTNFNDLTLLKNQINTLEHLDLINCNIDNFSFLEKFKKLTAVSINVNKEKHRSLSKLYPTINFENKKSSTEIKKQPLIIHDNVITFQFNCMPVK